MSVQKAILVHSYRAARLITDHQIPPIREDSLLVEVKAVSLNPADWKSLALDPLPAGSVLGCDYAGIVKKVSEGRVQKEWKVGDRIAGFTHGANLSRKEDGSFAEHIVAKTGVALRIPDSLSFESASTLTVGIVSCAQGLYKFLRLPLPNRPTTTQSRTPILIYGGSSATGTLAIQYAKLSGFTVIATCSPNNFDLVQSRGADYVFDYKSPSIIQDIQSATNNDMQYIFNCVGDSRSSEICYAAISSTGGRYCSLTRPVPTKKSIQISNVNAYNSLNESFSMFGFDFPQDTETYEFVSEFVTLSEKLLAEGKLKPHPLLLRPGGLEGILDGMKELESGNVRGGKLVYTI